MVEFTDEASVEAWLQGRPVAEIAVFAGLAAARGFPRTRFETTRTEHDHDLKAARALLTSFVRGISEEDAVKQAAADAATSSASAAAFSAAAFAAASVSARHLEAGGVSAAMSAPLWDGERPERFAGFWADMKKDWSADLAVWGFWIDWYEGLLEGRAPDWALWREVALIPNEVWKAGPEAVALAIEGVKAELVSKRLPLAEDLVADAVTGLFSVVPRVVQNLPLLAASLGQVADAVEDVLAEPSNGLREDSSDIRKLRRTVARYANDPQRVEMDMTVVSGSLLRQVAGGGLPASSSILALHQIVQQTADGLRAAHPEIAANRALLRGQARKDLSDGQIAQIAAAGEVLAGISEGALQAQMGEDVFALTEQMRIGAPRLAGVTRNGGDEIVRIGGRAARMSLMLRKSRDLVHKLEGSTGFKAVTIIGTIAGLIALLLPLFV